MRIKAIGLAWFRGAADLVSMEPECRSMVIYGANGSGKSSFVDAIEYVLNDGKIGHLAHEYSGKHLKNALPNTHKPQGAKTKLSIKFDGDMEVRVGIKDDGSTNTSGSIGAWDYRRTVLRQGEVVEFIQDTKGGKYSALLPLFGLHQMEVAAENLRQLAKNVESLSQFERRKAALVQAKGKRIITFGSDTDDQISKKIQVLHGKYCAKSVAKTDVASRCTELAAAIDTRITQLSADQRRQFALRGAAEIELKTHVDAVRAASVTLAGAVDPLISQKLAVLQPTEALTNKLIGDGEVECPACGQFIQVTEFREHVRAELERLRGIIETFNARNEAMGGLSDGVKSLKVNLGKADLNTWRDELARGTLAECFAHMDSINAEALRTACGATDLEQIENKLLPLVAAAASASVDAPPDAQELLNDKRLVEGAKAAIQINEEAADVARAETLITLIRVLEQTTREEIRLRSNAVIAEISEDIKEMWSILHPGEAIENVHLYLPKDTDKAIDIGLKFHGKDLESPRLTLSEGYRNSLGLCIFLAMAKREAIDDRPVVLDDVVISLDRNHRGMIVELLAKKFGARQVVILTHDRDWYAELRQQLDEGAWTFRALLPYETPQVGIRWSDKAGTFNDARAQLVERPHSAANSARKIMDVELSLIAERLQIKLPYLRFDKNERRTAHDFLERIVADGKRCLQKSAGVNFAVHEDAIAALNEADTLLVSWANRGSHSFDVTPSEATKLIDVCEKALAFFKCASCGKYVWFADVGGAELIQCQCAGIRWRYGKG
jgi:energy-coupling factor transporter ATP-binding protein EcfA2